MADEDKWMQDVHPKKNALHKQLHIPADQGIPTKTLEQKAHSPGSSLLLKRRANLALRYRGKADGGVAMPSHGGHKMVDGMPQPTPAQKKRKVRFACGGMVGRQG